jgi:serine protease
MSDRDTSTDRRSVVQALGALASLAAAGVTKAVPGRQPGPKEDELLVGTAPSASVESTAEDARKNAPANVVVSHRNERLGYMAIELPDEASAQARASVKKALEKRPTVAYVEENVTYETQVAPNDPYFDSQYAPEQVNAPSAWDTTFGSTDVTVAIIDTGAEYTHEDLSVLYASDPGYDFVDDDGDPYPDSGASHGTHVSGCASADTDNGIGVTGISDSRLINARCLGGSGGGSLSDIADGIQWAADQGADVINMSLGGGGYTQTVKNAVSYAADRGSLLVAAAGNDGQASVSYPAAHEECVAVSALDPDENLASFSNYGDAIEVAAPGVNVLSTYPGDDYRELSGTSMASPVAAGVAALGLATDPGLSASQLRQRLADTAVDIGLPRDQQGAGRVDAANIVGENGDDGGGGGDQQGYRLINRDGDLALDVENGSTENGVNVQQWDWNGSAAQQFEIQSDGDAYLITNVNSGRALDVEGASTENGATVLQWDVHGGDNQRWNFYDLGNGYYAIRNVNSGKYLTGYGSSPGDDVFQWEWFNGPSQYWSVEQL